MTKRTFESKLQNLTATIQVGKQNTDALKVYVEKEIKNLKALCFQQVRMLSQFMIEKMTKLKKTHE